MLQDMQNNPLIDIPISRNNLVWLFGKYCVDIPSVTRLQE